MPGADIEASKSLVEQTLHAVTGTAKALGLDIEDPKVKAFIAHTSNIQAQQHAESNIAWGLVNSIPPKLFEEYK